LIEIGAAKVGASELRRAQVGKTEVGAGYVCIGQISLRRIIVWSGSDASSVPSQSSYYGVLASEEGSELLLHRSDGLRCRRRHRGWSNRLADGWYNEAEGAAGRTSSPALRREGDTVTVEPQISYRDVSPSPALDHLIRAEVAKLEHFFDRILNCRVHLERTHRRHLRGSAVHVCVELTVPGEHLVVNHTDDMRPLSSSGGDVSERIGKPSERQAEHKDPQLAVRDAFRTATSRLQDYVKQRRDS
jgi:ribosome-associated translation inhibitor RaiA